MTELEALRRVAEAARKWRDWAGDRSFIGEQLRHWCDLHGALSALDALPAPAAEEPPHGP